MSMASSSSSAFPQSSESGWEGRARRLRERIAATYDVASERVALGDHVFTILAVRDTNALLERITPEEFAHDERLPYWAQLWSSSLALARYCLDAPWVAGARVLELGCGVGLAGIAASRAGACVTMTDYEADGLLFAEYNALMNLPPDGGAKGVEFRLLDWRGTATFQGYDLVIGADITYERSMFDPLLATLRSAVRAGGRIVLTDPDRAVGRDFVAAARAAGFRAQSARTTVCRLARTTAVICTQLTPGT